MSRKGKKKVIPAQVIPEHVAPEYTTWRTEYHCDSCGREISPEDHGEGYAHELEVALDPQECVSFYRRRDLCPACLEPIWAAISKLLGADPDAERDKEYD